MMHANNKRALLAAIIVLLVAVNATIAYADQATRDDAVRAIARSERDIDEMNAQGLRTLAMNDSLAAAKQALERADFADSVKDDERAGIGFEARKALSGVDSFAYAEVLKYTDEIRARRRQAFDIMDSIAVLYEKLDEFHRMNTSDAESILANAKAAFEKERYAEAELILDDLEKELETQSAQRYVGNVLLESGRGFLRRNLIGLTIFGILLVTVTAASWKYVSDENMRKKLKDLKREQKALKTLIKKAQEARYGLGDFDDGLTGVRGSMMMKLKDIHEDDPSRVRASDFEYTLRIEMYNQRLAELEERIPVLEAHIRNR